MDGEEINLGDAATRREAAANFLRTSTEVEAGDGELSDDENTALLSAGEGENEGGADSTGDEVADDAADEAAGGNEPSGDEADPADEDADDTKDDKTGGDEPVVDDDEVKDDEVTPEQQTLLDHNELFEGLVEALDETDYPVDFTDPEKGMEEIGLRLADAHAMYAMMDGNPKGAELIFERLLKFQGQAAHDFALNKVLEYAKKKGLIDAVDEEATDVTDPVAVENARLKKELSDKTATEQQKAVEGRKMAIFNSAAAELKKLATERNIDEADFNDFLLPQVAKMVSGNKGIINRVARGNFVDIHRIADEVINRLNGKTVAKNNEKVAGRVARDKKVPKRLAGGHTQTSTPAKANLANGDERRAAAKKALRG